MGTVARHQFLEYVYGIRTSKALSMAQAGALIDWAVDKHYPRSGPHVTAIKEGWIVVEAWGAEHGQLRLEVGDGDRTVHG